MIILVGYSYLNHNHLYNLVSNQQYNITGVSIITLGTSMYTIHSNQIK
jgi:hypothetical protein